MQQMSLFMLAKNILFETKSTDFRKMYSSTLYLFNLVFLNHYSKPYWYDVDFVFVETDKCACVLVFFFQWNYKTPRNKKNPEINYLVWCHMKFSIIAEIKGIWCYVTLNTCVLSPCNRKPYLKHRGSIYGNT